MRVLVMGIGNPLVCDEGVGIRVLQRLLDDYDFPPEVELVDAGTMGMSILNLFVDVDYLLVIDAVDHTGRPPGTVVLLAPEDLALNQVMHSLHDMRFVNVLEAAELIGRRPEAEFVGVQIADMGTVGVGLTPQVEAAVPEAERAVLELLARRGIGPVLRRGTRG